MAKKQTTGAHRHGPFTVVRIHAEDVDKRYKRVVARCDECDDEVVFHCCYPRAIGPMELAVDGGLVSLPEFFEVDHAPLAPMALSGVSNFSLPPVCNVTRFSIADGNVARVLCKWMTYAQQEARRQRGG